MSEHTPLPWHPAQISPSYGDNVHVARDGHHLIVCLPIEAAGERKRTGSKEEAAANRALIVEAVNSHETNKARIAELEMEKAALVAQGFTLKQATNCAGCGQFKHTPLRRDEMGGYVCMTCVDKALDTRPAPDPKLADLEAENARLRSALSDLVEWLHDNRMIIEGEFSMDDLLSDARAALRSQSHD